MDEPTTDDGAGPTSPTPPACGPPACVRLPRHLWPIVNVNIPSEYQQLAPGQVLVVPVILQIGPGEPK
jgi:hypothetical protein